MAKAKKTTPVLNLEGSSEEAELAYNKMVAKLESAWKTPTPGITGDTWTDAVMALHDRNDINALSDYLNSNADLTSQRRTDVARILRLLHTKANKRKRGGRPGGTSMRWTDPNYVTEWFIRRRTQVWCDENNKPKTPKQIRDEIVERTINEINKWAFARRKKADLDRVARIMNEPLANRLP